MNEITLIKLAINKDRIARYEQFLNKPNKRKELLDKLNHNPPLNEKRTKWFKSLNDAVKSIKIKANEKVILISSAIEIDGKSMPLNKAVEETEFYGWGTIIGISPNLAIYYGESGERAAVIHKNA